MSSIFSWNPVSDASTLDLHFQAVVLHPDGPNLDSVFFKQFPHVGLLELDWIVTDIDLVLSPANE